MAEPPSGPDILLEAPRDCGAADAHIAYAGDDLEVLAASRNYYNWIFDLIRPYVSGDVVEYGAGLGTISQRLLPEARSLSLVEPEAHLADRLRLTFSAEASVAVFTQTLEQHVETCPSESVDTAVLVNVLEHVDDDRRAVGELIRILRRNGHLIVFVPALRWLMSDLDRLHGHFRRYHLRQLAELIPRAAGTVVKLRYFDMAGVLPWWLVNTIGRQTTFNPRAVRLFDRVAVPVTRRFEGFFSPPFGKNLILVARKM